MTADLNVQIKINWTTWKLIEDILSYTRENLREPILPFPLSLLPGRNV